ncbi:MAG: hypothetical protein P8Y21_13660 [Gemmatimonadales bacterium]|jgi:hypothetical protein
MTASLTLRATWIGTAVALAALTATACQDGSALGPDALPDAQRVEAKQVAAMSHEPQPVPFKGTLVTTESVPDPMPPAGCQAFLHTGQRGNFTHVGLISGTGTTCAFNGQLGVRDPPFNPGGGPPPYFVTDFSIEQTYTAANGDILEISGVGVLVQSMTDGRSGLVGTGLIEGGTGRFADATGEFEVRGANGVVHYDGWIAYQASNRSGG